MNDLINKIKWLVLLEDSDEVIHKAFTKVKKRLKCKLKQEKIEFLEELLEENIKNCQEEKKENPELWHDWLWSANFKILAENKLEELKQQQKEVGNNHASYSD